MSTSSAIIYKTATGYAGVYCHAEGYATGVGAKLDAHYNSQERAAALVELGDLSSLWPKLAPTAAHSFDKPQPGVTVAYMRDRPPGLWSENTSLADLPPKCAATAAEVADQIGHDNWVYVWEGDHWTVNGESLRLALADGELVNTDARYTPEAIETRKRTAKMLERQNRRLFAPDLDLTGDALDQTAGEFPLLAFRF